MGPKVGRCVFLVHSHKVKPPLTLLQAVSLAWSKGHKAQEP